MGIFVKALKWLGISVILLMIAFSCWVYVSTYQPNDMQQEAVINAAKIPQLSANSHVKILSWNVQFLASNQNNYFFYDGGNDKWPSLQTVEETADGIAEVIKHHDPDFVLLQEVDIDADRTHNANQMQMLLERLPQYQAHTLSYYWKADYVPHPQVAGKVGMALVVLSKYQIKAATRYALPAISTDDIVTRQFNLKRAMQQVTIPIVGGDELVLINTHLSAFAQGSDTMQKQIEVVSEHLAKLDQKTWIMAGDFNLLPDQAAYHRNDVYKDTYNAKQTELAPMLNKYASVPALDVMQKDPERWFTYMPGNDPKRTPDRTIDYVFYADSLALEKPQVVREKAQLLSDHLPIVASFRLQSSD